VVFDLSRIVEQQEKIIFDQRQEIYELKRKYTAALFDKERALKQSAIIQQKFNKKSKQNQCLRIMVVRRIGLVLRGSKLHGYGLVVGEATIEGSHKINPQQWILDNYDKHFYDGEKQFTWVWHLSNIVRYDVYRHLQGSQTPVFLYNLHEYTLLIKK